MSFVQFWTVAPPDHLLARLEVDPPSVAKRIVTLLVASYFPVDKDSNELLTRTVTLIKTNPGAARKFYQYAAQQHVSPVNTGLSFSLSNLVIFTVLNFYTCRTPDLGFM